MSSFPQPWISTTSHWQATNRGPTSLFSHGKDTPLPSEVDILIIGAGLSGAALSYHLTRSDTRKSQRIALLEAKDVASGATGRNGGHCAPASFSSFPSLIKPLEQGGAGISPESALHVLENEHDTLNLMDDVFRFEKLDVDFWRGEKLEVTVDESGAGNARTACKAFKAAKGCSKRYVSATGRLPWEWELIDDPGEARRISRIPTALTISRGPAGSLHPHKLATSLIELALSKENYTYHSWCPVVSMNPIKHKGYAVDCGRRGTVLAKRVILCTNAHTKHLFPSSEWSSGVSAHITPYRGHAGNITTTLPYSGANSLSYTYGIQKGPYLISTPSNGIIMGPYNATMLGGGLVKDEEIFGQVDDSVVLPQVTDWLKGYCKNTFEGWGEEGHGEGLTRVWSGIMAASGDHLPLVGEIPDMPNMYACVAFHGHGMARIMTCTRGLAYLLEKGEWDARLPRVFDITQERLDRVRLRSRRIGLTISKEEASGGNESVIDLVKET